VQAALGACDAGTLVRDTLAEPGVAIRLRAATAVDVIAAGKASSVMRQAFVSHSLASLRTVVATGPDTGHPLPNEESVRAARRALELAAAACDTDLLVVLLSGGASAKMAAPAEGLTLTDKQRTVRQLLLAGADIRALNTVRKHLSAIKGGWLAQATRAQLMTLAVSDVVGDDPSLIASGPTVPDPTTFADALAVLDAHGGRALYPDGVVRRLDAGAEGRVAETPKPGEARASRGYVRIIGNRFTAMAAARACAERLGFRTHVLDAAVVGEARAAAPTLVGLAASLRAGGVPCCVIASGETTVRVTGRGRGGRNQELALAMLAHLSMLGDRAVAASVGTDGVDGPTDAAGAVVDSTSAARAAARALDPAAHLADNDAYAFFDALGDAIRTGPTATNVGDLQLILTT
jgi:hydroxypyruvate reductase